MGEYAVDFTKDEIIIDGHKFVKTDLPGIFKCTDEYKIYGSDWATDVRNKDISVFVRVKGNKPYGVILYAYRFDNKYANELLNKDEVLHCDEDDHFHFFICAYNSTLDNIFLCM